jgi:tetratricopeptide (TPR) repeat protein
MAYTSEIDKLERRLRENPEGRTFAPLADAYRKAGDVPRALEILKTGLQLHPDYLSASIVLGRCHLDLGDLASAESAFRRVLDLDKENVIAIKALADITERQTRFDESEHWLNYLLSIDGSNDEARNQLQRLETVREQHGRLSGTVDAQADSPAEPEEEPDEEPEATETVTRAPSFGEADTVEITLAVSVSREPAPEPEPEPLVDELEPVQPDEEVSTLLDEVDEMLEPTAPAPSGFQVYDRPHETDDLRVEREADPLGEPSVAEHFDVGVERHEEIVLRPSAASEFQSPSDSELLGGRSSQGFTSPFEEDSPAPATEPVSQAPQPEPEPELPQPEPEPEPEPAPAMEEVAAVTSEDLWQSHPEDATAPEPEPELEPAVDDEPVAEEAAPARVSGPAAEGPLVTETIGDVYAAQGHTAQALEVYRQLLQRTPNDLRLTEKIEELQSRQTRRATPPPGPRRGYAATETGGRSVLSYMGDLLSAQLPVSNGSPNENPSEPTGDAASTGFMEEAFQTDEETVSGEPTRPASGPLSLSAIFGEDSSPVPPVVAGPEVEGAKPAASHFDEFFGERPTPQTSTTRTRSVKLDSDQDDLEQFHKWLKGLKR